MRLEFQIFGHVHFLLPPSRSQGRGGFGGGGGGRGPQKSCSLAPGTRKAPAHVGSAIMDQFIETRMVMQCYFHSTLFTKGRQLLI